MTEVTHTISINECGGCGGRHEGVEVVEYSTPRKPYTHWFRCPTTGDPVSLAIVQHNGRDMPLSDSVVDAVAEAMSHGRWLSAIFHINDKGELTVSRTVSANFPYGDLHGCVDLLAKDLGKLEGAPPPREMDRVAEMPPSVNLFG